MSAQIRLISFEDASIGSIMVRDVKTVDRTKPIVESVKLMKECDIGSLVVTDGIRPVGIFTERDLIKKIAEKLENLGVPIGQVASKHLITISSAATVWDALILMSTHNIRRLPVMERKKLVGIVTERDIFKLILSREKVKEIMP